MHRKYSYGFTLLEMFISLSIGLIIISISLKFLTNATNSQKLQLNIQTLYQNIQKTDEILREIISNTNTYVHCPVQFESNAWNNLKLGKGVSQIEQKLLTQPIWGGSYTNSAYDNTINETFTFAKAQDFTPTPTYPNINKWLAPNDFLQVNQLVRLPNINFNQTTAPHFTLTHRQDPSFGIETNISNSNLLVVTDCINAYLLAFSRTNDGNIAKFTLFDQDLDMLINANFNFQHIKLYWLQKTIINIELKNNEAQLIIENGASSRILNISNIKRLQLYYHSKSQKEWLNAQFVEKNALWQDINAIAFDWISYSSQILHENRDYDLEAPFNKILKGSHINIKNTQKYYLRTGSIIYLPNRS